ncbi:MAG: outer membrane lipoprotein chaperone LolA [Gallionellaceae bacterium]|jgi:chaperone LolA
MTIFKALSVALFLFSANVYAAASDKLKTFITATHSAQANFTQDVYDKKGNAIQSSSGTMQFVRPGKFRWVYLKPYEQIIVGDGKKFWLYDADLNQVTVKKLDAALGGSPAALLSGNNEIEKDFALQNRGEINGLDWLEAKPKTADSGIEKMLMGFNTKSELVVMELFDSFGHRTVLRFSALKTNPQLAPHLFNFVPPQGADVLGE